MNRAINVQTCQVHSIRQQSEGRVVHRFKGFSKAPALDANLSQSSAVLEPDVCEESVYEDFRISISSSSTSGFHHIARSVSGAKNYRCSGNTVRAQDDGTEGKVEVQNNTYAVRLYPRP